MQEPNNKQQFEAIYKEYYHFVLMLCFSYFHDLSTAEDALQEVFLKYLTKNPIFPNSYAARSWLYNVTKHQCLDILRKRKKEKNNKTIIVNESENQTEAIKIRQQVYSLPEKYRIVIILYYYQGYSIEETAMILNISASAVKKRLERARNQLKEYLK